MIRKISQSLKIIQSYRRQGERVAPDDFPMYSESATITKIDIDGALDLRISQILITPNTFRSKQAVNNPPSIAFVFADDLERLFTDDFDKLVDVGEGTFTQTILAGDDFPIFENEQDINYFLPRVVGYDQIPEFADYPTNSVPNYLNGYIGKILLDPENKIKKTIGDVFMLQSASPIQITSDILFQNSNGMKSLYLIPFFNAIQRTEIVLTARINFVLEY